MTDTVSLEDVLQEAMQSSPEFKKGWLSGGTTRAILGGLVALRNAAGLTQSRLAERAKWNKGFVSRLECGRGKLPDTATILRYAQACGGEVRLELETAHGSVIRTDNLVAPSVGRRSEQGDVAAPRMSFDMDVQVVDEPFSESVSARKGHRRSADLGRDVHEFVRLLLSASYRAVVAYLDELRMHGVQSETLMLELFAPAARQLGEMWKADLCSFVEVTRALSLLQRLARKQSGGVGLEALDWKSDHQVLLAPLPERRRA